MVVGAMIGRDLLLLLFLGLVFRLFGLCVFVDFVDFAVVEGIGERVRTGA